MNAPTLVSSSLLEQVDACGLTFDYLGGGELSPVGAVWSDELGGLAVNLLFDCADEDWAQGALDSLGWTLDGIEEGDCQPVRACIVPIELAQAVLDHYPDEVREAIREQSR